MFRLYSVIFFVSFIFISNFLECIIIIIVIIIIIISSSSSSSSIHVCAVFVSLSEWSFSICPTPYNQ